MQGRRRAPSYRGEGAHALWHLSEDATIERSDPHVAATSLETEPLVWAIDTRHLPEYWFPRDCPRGTFWPVDTTTGDDVERLLLGKRRRVHAIESAWLDRVRVARAVVYRLREGRFEPYTAATGHWVAASR
jgi:hypothetical protein